MSAPNHSTPPAIDIATHAAPFLEVLFEDVEEAGHYIHVSLIEDRGKDNGDARVRGEYSYASAVELVADLPRLERHALACGAALFYATLPRSNRAGRRAANAAPGWVAWLDIDFKDVLEEEAWARLDELGLPPSIVIRSGHGLHVYWLFKEATDPVVLSGISRRLQRSVRGADHCFDAARLLRIPGSANLKECWRGGEYHRATNSPRSQIERLDAHARYNPSDFDFLPGVEPESAIADASLPRANTKISAGLPDAVKRIMERRPHVADLFAQRGKVGGDQTNSGYLWSLANSLARHGIRDPDVLDAALNAMARTDGKPWRTYDIRRAADRAIATARQDEERHAASVEDGPAVDTDDPGPLGAPPPDAPPPTDDDAPDTRAQERRALPEIKVGTDMPEVVRLAWAALVANQGNLGVYQRGGRLVQLVRDAAARRLSHIAREADPTRIAPLGKPTLCVHLASVALFYELKQNAKGLYRKPCIPPKWLVDALDEAPDMPVRQLEGLIEAPTLRRDGSMLATPGYDEATGLYLEPPDGLVVKVPEAPTKADAIEALGKLSDLLADFPFEETCHRHAAVAALLTILVRHLIAGCCPLFLFGASAPKTGKTLLVDALTGIASGRDVARFPHSESEEETRKAITALAMAATPMVLIDNVAAPLGGAALDAALTSRTWSDRVLGASTVWSGPLTTVWWATANNVSFRGDMAKRVIPVMLRTDLERPELRDDFRFPDLRRHVREHRGELLGAALTIVRAYIRAGRPAVDLPRFGGFEAWSDAIRRPLVWAGAEDPCAGVAALAEDADTKTTEMATLMAAWRDVYGSTEITLSRVAVDLSTEGRKDPLPEAHRRLIEALRPLAYRGGKLDTGRLGRSLRGWRQRVVKGHRWATGPAVHGVVSWRVESVEQPRRCASCGGTRKARNADGYIVCASCVPVEAVC
ncbi:MAG: hypothetical protein ACOZNI_12975 [Myxococcota bacterium]